MYLHGAYGQLIPTQDTLPPSGVATLPVYIGTAPVQQIIDYSNVVNKPILINSFDEAKSKIGYSDDWKTFTLCEAVFAHFRNKIQPIGPIAVINVMNPDLHTKSGTSSVQLINKKGYISVPAILSSIEIEGKVKGADFNAEYTTDGRILITDLSGTLVTPVTVNFEEMDVTKITDSDLIGGMDSNGNRSGLKSIELVYQTFGTIPSILAAPGWSQKPAIANAMISAVQKINGHWDAIAIADIDSNVAKTVDSAKTWIDTNSYRSNVLKVCWPKVRSGDNEFWLSTLTSLCMQQTDYTNDNVPYESPSNKKLDIIATVANNAVIAFDELQGNDLNASGITTVNYRAGNWVLWGPHMSNYKFSDDTIAPEKIFDCSARMGCFLMNTFQKKYALDIDTYLNRTHVDTILNDAQIWLNSLVADGKILYAKILFNETSNPVSSIIEGDFMFDVKTTYTPPGKSLTFKIQYTNKGLESLTGGENA